MPITRLVLAVGRNVLDVIRLNRVFGARSRHVQRTELPASVLIYSLAIAVKEGQRCIREARTVQIALLVLCAVLGETF